MADLPTWDDAVSTNQQNQTQNQEITGPQPDDQKPTWEQALATGRHFQSMSLTGAKPSPTYGAQWDNYMRVSPAGRILDAMGQGERDGWGAEPLGLPQDTIEQLRKAGLFNDYSAGRGNLLKTFNEALLRSSAIGLDLAFRRIPGVLYGATRGLAEGLAGEGPVGQAAAAPFSAATAMMEAFPAGHASGFPTAIPPEIADARRLGVIGPGGEGAWKGDIEHPPMAAEINPMSEWRQRLEGSDRPISDRPPTGPQEPTASVQPPSTPFRENLETSGRPIQSATGQPTLEGALPVEPAAPATNQPFFEPTLGRAEPAPADAVRGAEAGEAIEPRLAEPGAAAAPEPEAGPPDIHSVAREIAPDLFHEWDALAAERDIYARELADLPEGAGERPSGASVTAGTVDQRRAQLQDLSRDVGRRMLDLSPDVRRAYQEAQARMPDEPVPETTNAAPTTAPVEEPSPAPTPAEAGSAPVEGAPEVADIAADVSKKLVSTGRPQEEADAAGAIEAARYVARSANLRGTTPEQLYTEQGPDITSGRATRKRGTTSVAGDGSMIVRIMANSNASTALHEFGHTYLEELMTDAADERATDAVRGDAQTVRDWLGVEGDGPISGGQHEKFARGFERYMMEGVAPSTKLAGVFAKFKAWLSGVYQTVAKLRSPITPDIRAVFDRLLATPDEAAIAPERAANFADEHEAVAERARPEDAAAEADRVRSEADTVARVNAPEVANELGAGRGEAGGNAGEGAAVDRDGNAAEPGAGPAGAAGGPGTVGAGGGEVAGEGGGARAAEAVEKPPAHLLARVPKEPTRLASFLQRAGGLRDEGGDLREIIGGSKGRPGMINNKAGMSLDDAALFAWESGYFPELGTERPTESQLLAAIERDIKQAPVYSEHDRAAVRAYTDATEHNAEVDRIAHELGIDTSGLSHAQFWDRVAERLSEDAAAREAGDREATFDARMQEAEDEHRKWLESRGDAWEPDRHAEGDSRTLDDLERENQQREAAARAGESASRDGEPGPAGSAAGGVQGGGGPGGGGARPGRGDAAAGGAEGGGTTESPAGPNSPFPAEPTRYIDKAGNIRLDKLDAPESVKDVIRQAAEANQGFEPQRRGVIHDGELLDLADALGMDPAFLDKKKIGDAFSAEEVIVAKRLLIQSATAVRDAMRDVVADNPASVSALAEAITRHEMIQGQVSQAAAEAGRALAAHRILVEGSDGVTDLNAFLKENTGRTFNQLVQMAKYGQNLKTAQQVGRFVDATGNGKIQRAVIYYYTNALISGPITHLRYSAGNALQAVFTPLVTIPLAAGRGAAREALGFPTASDRVYLGEAGAQLMALAEGARKGLSDGIDAFRDNLSPPLPGERGGRGAQLSLSGVPTADIMLSPIPGLIGTAIGVPGRSVAAIHSFFTALRYTEEIHGAAYRIATAEGLEGNEFNQRFADLTRSPTEAMQDAATSNALRELYMRPLEYNSKMATLVRASNQYTLAKIMVPFMRIGTEITRNAFIEGSPLGLASRDIRAELGGAHGGAAGDMQFGRIMSGVAVAGTMATLVLEGMATGDGPDDPQARAAWLLNHKPNHLNIGPISIPYAGLGSLGMQMRFIANMTESVRGWGPQDGHSLAFNFMHSIVNSVLDDNWMRGLSEALNAAFHPDEYGDAYIKSLPSRWIPFSIGLGQVARAVDPYRRDVKTPNTTEGTIEGIFKTARANIPFASQGLFPVNDMFGEPVPSDGVGASDRYANDPVAQTLQRLDRGISPVERKLRGVALTDEQYFDLTRIAGRLTKLMLNRTVAQPGFERADAGIQETTIKHDVEAARKAAEAKIFFLYPDIIKTANAEKRAERQSGLRSPAGGAPQTVH